MAYQNIEDKRQYDRDYHARRSPAEKAAKLKRQRDRAHRLTAMVNEYKVSRGCNCGEKHPACLEFHHVSGAKEMNVGDASRLGWSVDRLMREIAKCVVVCSNCHRKIHYQGVAQPAERVVRNHEAAGAEPAVLTKLRLHRPTAGLPPD